MPTGRGGVAMDFLQIPWRQSFKGSKGRTEVILNTLDNGDLQSMVRYVAGASRLIGLCV